jgi:hypothetical protein
MTVKTISVTAEWAKRGKTPQDRGYRLLGCSDGELSGRNFEDAINRYLPGTLDILPQVSVSYLQRADQVGGSYLALAIHEFASDGQFDAAGREIAFIRYFCVPYHQLSADAVSYLAMYDAFRPLRLPKDSGPPERVTLEVRPPRVPVDDVLARQVAALLLDGPVCVLGADRTEAADRLRFIDTVMSLLPYGMRSRMSASTWTSSSYGTHRFRLFFSNAPRATDGKDHLVIWGQPGRTAISPELGYAYDYLGWLEDKLQQPVLRLSEVTDELGFGATQVLKMLELVGIAGDRPDLDYAADRQDLLHPSYTPPQASGGFAETTLRECAGRLKAGNLSGLKSDIAALKNYTDTTGKDDRRRYQDIIFSHQLLRPNPDLGRLGAKFYDVLLRMAFGLPLSYEGYCQLESCLGISPGDAPHRPLLEAVEHGGTADARVTAIVLRYLGGNKLTNWFRSHQVNAGQLIAWLAGNWDRPEHARIVCDVTVAYLTEMRGSYDLEPVRAALHKHGYLGQALQLRHPHEPQYQVVVLYRSLLAASGGKGLGPRTVDDVMTGTGLPPTPALLAAVLLLLADPADATLARELYITGLFRYTAFDADTRARLNTYTPRDLMVAERLAIEPAGPRHSKPVRPEERAAPQLELMRGLTDAAAKRKRWLVQKFDRSEPEPNRDKGAP